MFVYLVHLASAYFLPACGSTCGSNNTLDKYMVPILVPEIKMVFSIARNLVLTAVTVGKT